MPQGYFITFEGGEGVGKTTQISHLKETLIGQGRDVIMTREPGGTKAAEEIRTLLSHQEYGGQWSPEAELLLLFAARSMHIKEVIAPALQEGKIILCDRYVDSTRVYQGHLQNVDMGFISSLEEKIIGSAMPDLTIIMDLEASAAMERVKERGAQDHYDMGDEEFYDNLHKGFQKIAEENPDRCVMIDAARDEAVIAKDIIGIVEKRLS